MTTLEINHHLVNVNISGSGEPMLFLHGVPDSSEVWEGVIRHLSNEFMCIAPDLPGFGLTRTKGRFEYTLNNLADFIDALIQKLDIGSKVHLVIHDIGGIVGLAFSSKYLSKVKSLTIMDTTFFSNHEWHALATVWRKPVIGDLAMHLMRYKQFHKAMKKAAPILTEKQIQSNYSHLKFKNRRMILQFYRALDPSIFKGWEEALLEATSRLPSQVIWGSNDKFLPPSLAQRFGAQEVHILKEVGHWPMLERESDVVHLIRRLATSSDEQYNVI